MQYEENMTTTTDTRAAGTQRRTAGTKRSWARANKLARLAKGSPKDCRSYLATIPASAKTLDLKPTTGTHIDQLISGFNKFEKQANAGHNKDLKNLKTAKPKRKYTKRVKHPETTLLFDIRELQRKYNCTLTHIYDSLQNLSTLTDQPIKTPGNTPTFSQRRL